MTAYCPCAICCGPYANGITASGKVAAAKHTIAVDAYNPVVPMGTKVIIEGTEYTVEDRISRIEIAKKTWHWQRGVYESIKHFLDASIEQLDKLQESVLSSMKEAGVRLENAVRNDFEIDERIFSAEEFLPVAVVAEDKNQYGADAFEEYMKNEGEIEKTPVVVEPNDKKR